MKCDNCKKQNGVRCRCKLCKRMICNDCWGKSHNSNCCLRCEGEYNRINPRLRALRDGRIGPRKMKSTVEDLLNVN